MLPLAERQWTRTLPTRSFHWVVAMASVVCCVQPAFPIGSTDIDHPPAVWNTLLTRYVANGRVDYAAILESRANEIVKAGLWDGPMEHAPGWMLLTQYLAWLAAADPKTFSSTEARQTFWINAYNACVIKGVLDHYPIKSVKDVKGFFDKIRYQVAGESLTLNQIEAKGRALGDWRLHFAVVCAARGCPPLRSEAYVPAQLEAQLTDQVRRYLADRVRGLRLGPDESLWVSKIFSWYAKDFAADGKLSAERLLQLLQPYLDPETAQTIGHELVKDYVLHVRFLDYDWSLNTQTGY